MRLGQLSRKLGISTSQIISFLAAKDITIGEDSNTKIEDEHVQWVTKKYAPELIEAVAVTISEEKVQPIVVIEPTTIEVAESIIAEANNESPSSEAEQLRELIKAPKIELSGLKVLGKIEIPEKKKKETTSDAMASEAPSDETERKVNPDRRPNINRREYEERPRKNPVALQREHEEREVEKKRQAELLRAKEKKAQHYQSKVKTHVVTKRIKVKYRWKKYQTHGGENLRNG
jgi:hypothetical protein